MKIWMPIELGMAYRRGTVAVVRKRDGRRFTTAPVARSRFTEIDGRRYLATTTATAEKYGWDTSKALPRGASA